VCGLLKKIQRQGAAAKAEAKAEAELNLNLDLNLLELRWSEAIECTHRQYSGRSAYESFSAAR
jgi:hypothetical protein